MRNRKPMSAGLPPSRYLLVTIPLMLVATSLGRAELQVAQPEVDAGQVRAGAPLAHRFTFVNQGPQAIEITDLQASCGCLTPKLEQRWLKPGESGALVMEVNTLSQAPGRHVWQIKMIGRNEDGVFDVPLRIKATLIREIVVEPASVTVFADSAVTTEIHITDLRPQPLVIKEIRTSSPGLLAQPAGESRDKSGKIVRKIRLQMTGDFPDGRHDEFLSLYTDDPAYREIRVPVTIIKRPRQRVSAAPNQVELLASPGQPVPSRIVLVRDSHDQEVVVDTVNADNPAITCQWAKGPGSMVTLKITADRNRIGVHGLQASVLVNISKPVKQTLTIPIRITLQ